MTRLIDADFLIKTLNEQNIPVDVRVNYEIMNAPTIEPDGDTISRSRAIKDISEWATDILHPDRLVKEDAIHILESLSSAETSTASEKHQLSEETSTNTSTDLISRQDAIEAFYEPKNGGTYAELNDGSEWYMTSKEIYAVLESIPSAPDSRQRGEWVDNHNGTFTCDQCGWKHSKSNFCPNCGADMRRGDNNGLVCVYDD